MKAKRLRIGDIFEVPLSDGRKAYGQYVLADKKNGPMVRIFNLVTTNNVPIEKLINLSLLFPPIFVGLKAAIKIGQWKVIGNSPVNDFNYPCFISAMYDSVNKKMGMWYLWNGAEYTPIGHKLPEEYKKFEQLVVWAPGDVEKRIETGINPIDYWLDL